MKLRIQDNSIRFRITIRELELLATAGRIESLMRFPTAAGDDADASLVRFRYMVVRSPDLAESTFAMDSHGMTLRLCATDYDQLANPQNEGAYIQREWLENGKMQRAMVFIEKDRPGSSCEKPEEWIYDMNPGSAPTRVPAPPAKKG